VTLFKIRIAVFAGRIRIVKSMLLFVALFTVNIDITLGLVEVFMARLIAHLVVFSGKLVLLMCQFHFLLVHLAFSDLIELFIADVDWVIKPVNLLTYSRGETLPLILSIKE
jgi:hypothetical protein